MSQWNIKPSWVLILGCVIFLMLLIVVLPDVDLPDAAFHGGTAPVVLHAHATCPPPALHVGSIAPALRSLEAGMLQYRTRNPLVSLRPNFLPILLRSIRC